MSHVIYLLHLALPVAFLLACSNDNSATIDSAGGRTVDSAASGAIDEDRPNPTVEATIGLLKTLADREEALLEMARIAVTRREKLDVSADARRILTEQRRESNRVLGALKGEYRTTHTPTITERGQQLVDTMNASGVGEFDRIFLAVVTQHYEEDVRLIDAALPKIENEQVRELVTEIRRQRVAEAAALRKRSTAVTSGN